MAAQHVQAYLERHRIGALFEDLMAKVISDTPDEPIPYLIRALKKLHTQPDGGTKGFGSHPPSRSRSPYAKSMGLTGTQISRQSFDEGGEHRSVLAKSWAGPDDHGKGSKFRPGSGSKVPGREYARPWLSGSKPPNGKSFGSSNKDNMRPPARSSHTRDNHEKPSWNAKTAVPTHDFDEWFSMQHRPRRTENEQMTHYQGATSWGRNGETEDMPVERTVHYQRRTAPALIYDGDDNLEEELYVGKEIKVRDEEDDSSSVQSYESNRSRKLKARHAAEEHRRQLQALLMSKGQSRGSSNGMSDNGDLHDDGMELLENVDELESEGVANIHSTGARVSKSMKQGATASESIRVSICARCAKVISGQPSERKYEVSSSVVSGSEVDDNFDSVSQVGSTTGPSRAPVWPSGFDSENDSSPRKSGGGHMWQNPSRSPPMKGRHMFRGGSFTGDAPDSSRPPTASSSRSDVGFPGRQQQSWNSGGYSSDNDTEANYDRVGSPEVASSRTWTRAPLESGSETDWDTRPGRRAPPGRGFARFDSGGESD